jgi:renalase
VKIAVIGAGIAGLTLAQRLKAEVTVLEKSRGVGGRMSTRHADPFHFDHGAQYLTIRTRAFKSSMRPHIESGLLQEWKPRVLTLTAGEQPYKRDWFEPHYVAAPGMNALAKKLAEGLSVQLQTEVAALVPNGKLWDIQTRDGRILGPYDWVISTAPAPQTQSLFADLYSRQPQPAQSKMTGCYTLMLGLAQPLKLKFDAARVKNSPIRWISVNSSKPGRELPCTLVIHSDNDWAEAHLEDDQDEIRHTLLTELARQLQTDLPSPAHIALHRWRYAETTVPLGKNYLIDTHKHLAACGDWCIRGNVEAAFTSANLLATRINKGHSE